MNHFTQRACFSVCQWDRIYSQRVNYHSHPLSSSVRHCPWHDRLLQQCDTKGLHHEDGGKKEKSHNTYSTKKMWLHECMACMSLSFSPPTRKCWRLNVSLSPRSHLRVSRGSSAWAPWGAASARWWMGSPSQEMTKRGTQTFQAMTVGWWETPKTYAEPVQTLTS